MSGHLAPDGALADLHAGRSQGLTDRLQGVALRAKPPDLGREGPRLARASPGSRRGFSVVASMGFGIGPLMARSRFTLASVLARSRSGLVRSWFGLGPVAGAGSATICSRASRPSSVRPHHLQAGRVGGTRASPCARRPSRRRRAPWWAGRASPSGPSKERAPGPHATSEAAATGAAAGAGVLKEPPAFGAF